MAVSPGDTKGTSLTGVIRFPPFEMDLDASILRRNGVAIALRPKNWDVLRYLVERPGMLISKDELLDRVWGAVSVSEGILSVSIRELRRCLGDSLRKPRLIETVHRRGYRFIGRVENTSDDDAPLKPIKDLRKVSSHFVSREIELDLLDEWWAQVVDLERRVVFINGSAGIGKSALLQEFQARLRRRGEAPGVAIGQCVPQYHSEDACFPILDAITGLCRSAIADEVIAVLRRTAPEWLIRLRDVITTTQREEIEATLRPQTAAWMLRNLVVALESIAANQPIILILEDLHWSDLATLDFVRQMAERRNPAQLFLICTRRSDESGPHAAELLRTSAELAARGRTETIDLGALSLANVEGYVEQTFGRAAALATLAPWLHERSDGNALFMVSLTAELIRRGEVHLGPAGWEMRTAAPDLREIPPTLDSILRARLAPLDTTNRRLLEAASMQGGLDFWDVYVSAADQRDAQETQERLHSLAETGPVIRWVADERWPDGTLAARFRFTHALYRQVLAEGLPLQRKSEWHRRIGERMESAFATSPDTVAAALAGHFDDAGDGAKASNWHAILGIDSTRRYAFAEAIGHLDRALQRMQPHTHPDSYRLLLLQAKAMALVCTAGTTHEVHDCWQEVLRLAEQMGDPFNVCWAWVGHLGYHCFRGEHREALGYAAKIREFGLREASPLFLVWGEFGLTAEQVMCGNLSEAERCFARGMAAYTSPDEWRPHHKPSPEAKSMGLMAMALAHSLHGRESEALRSIAEARQTISVEGKHFIGVSLALSFWTVMYALLRQAPQAYAKARETIEETERAGNAGLCGIASIVEGWALIAMGKPGLAEMQRGHELLRGASGSAQSICLMLLADAHATLGRVEEALVYASQGLQVAQERDEGLVEPELHRIHAELMLRRAHEQGRQGRMDLERDAEAELAKAMEMAQSRDMALWDLRAALTLGHLLARRGDAAAAGKIVGEAIARFPNREMTGDLRAALECLQGWRADAEPLIIDGR